MAAMAAREGAQAARQWMIEQRLAWSPTTVLAGQKLVPRGMDVVDYSRFDHIRGRMDGKIEA